MTIKKPNNCRHRHSGDPSADGDSRISPVGSKRGDSGQARMTMVASILAMAFFLRIYKLNDLMPFIGDFGWFYLSARDMLLTGNIPLVGIVSSHTWVHQGPLWTYLLAIPLFISNFNPVSGAYLTAIIGVLTVFLMYKIGSVMFSKNLGLIAAALYATSPLVVIHARLPYHTSLIPLMSILFIFFLYKWVKGEIRFLPFVFLALGVLYNLELATVVFWILLLLVFVYGAIKKEKWFREAVKLKTVLLSVFLFLLAMLPMIIYDFKENSGFYQITAFFRLIKIYLFSGSYAFSLESTQNIFSSLFIYNERLVFLGNGALALLLTVASFFYTILSSRAPLSRAWRSPTKSGIASQAKLDRNDNPSLLLLLFWIVIPLCAIIVSKTPSEAYVPMLFPAIIFSIALAFNYMYKRQTTIAVIVLLFVMITNSYLLISKNYLMSTAGGYGLPFSKRLTIAREIVKKSKGMEYNLVGKGKGSEHKSFTMNYEYLTWWLGNPPSKRDEKLKIVIRANENGIRIDKRTE